MIMTSRLRNKPLCMVENEGKIYIGDARGCVYEMNTSIACMDHLTTVSGPVSAMVFFNGMLFCGTWNGTVVQGTREVKLGSDPVKCMCVFRNALFVSVDTKLVVVDSNLTVVESNDTSNKIFCMEAQNDILRFGLGIGLVASYTNGYGDEHKSAHDTTVLCMRGGLTGSADGTLRRGREVIYTGSGWVRSVWDADLFSSGKDVVINGKVAYAHNDEVVGVVRHGKMVISIGLDYCCKTYEDRPYISEADEAELLEMLNS